MSDIKFVDGLIVKQPNPNAPDFVKMAISIKREELISWLSKESGDWINLDVKESKAGKWYCAVNEWKAPEGGQQAPQQGQAHRSQAPVDDFVDDIPFR